MDEMKTRRSDAGRKLMEGFWCLLECAPDTTFVIREDANDLDLLRSLKGQGQ
jgi:hypothetical protein